MASDRETVAPVFDRAARLLERAESCRREGDAAQARALCADALAQLRERYLPAEEARALLLLGELQLAADDAAGACVSLAESAARAMEAGDPLAEARARLLAAMALFDEGRARDAHDELVEALALFRAVPGAEGLAGQARAARLYGEHLAVQGARAEALEALELAQRLHESMGDAEGARGIAEDLRLVRGGVRPRT